MSQSEVEAERKPVPKPLMVLLSAMAALDMAMYAVVTPMLPSLQKEMGLSDSASGLLVAAYPFGLMVFAIPAGFVVGRWGAKPTLIAGAMTLGLTSAAFGLAASPEWLVVARGLQGVSAALSWAAAMTWLIGSAPRNRQGLLIGTVMAAAGAGAVAGPGLGVVAVLWTRGIVFVIVGLVAMAIAAALTRRPPPTAIESQGTLTTARGLMSGTGAVLMGLLVLCAVGLGAMAVFVPLRLDEVGASSLMVGGVLLGVAVIELIASPLIGRLVDGIGARSPLIVLLLLVTSSVLLHRFDSVGITAAIVLASFSAVGLLYTPILAGLTELTQNRGLAMAGLFGLSNLAFAIGESIGALSAGWFEEADSADLGLVILAAICVGTGALVARGLRPHN